MGFETGNCKAAGGYGNNKCHDPNCGNCDKNHGSCSPMHDKYLNCTEQYKGAVKEGGAEPLVYPCCQPLERNGETYRIPLSSNKLLQEKSKQPGDHDVKADFKGMKEEDNNHPSYYNCTSCPAILGQFPADLKQCHCQKLNCTPVMVCDHELAGYPPHRERKKKKLELFTDPFANINRKCCG